LNELHPLDVRRAFCGHLVPTPLAEPAVSPAGEPIWLCPDCRSAIPEQQEAKPPMPIQSIYQNGEWVPVERPVEAEHHCVLPINFKPKASSGAPWACPKCHRAFVLNRNPGTPDSWVNA